MKILLTLILVVSQMTFAKATTVFWGDTGHRTVGLIAEKNLSKKALRNIQKILGNESLAMASTWADFVKSDSTLNAQTSAWHYVNIPEGKSYEEMEKNPKGDVIEAIDRMVAILKDSKKSSEEKRFSLRFLVHLIGDIHQPMHAGRAEDLGGNRIKVKWFGKDSNLHRVWDSDIIDGFGLSFTELSEAINFADKNQVKAWQSSRQDVWAKESQEIAQKLYANTKDGDKLSYRYIYDHDQVLKMRLLQAGVRLAGVLNGIFR